MTRFSFGLESSCGYLVMRAEDAPLHSPAPALHGHVMNDAMHDGGTDFMYTHWDTLGYASIVQYGKYLILQRRIWSGRYKCARLHFWSPFRNKSVHFYTILFLRRHAFCFLLTHLLGLYFIVEIVEA